MSACVKQQQQQQQQLAGNGTKSTVNGLSKSANSKPSSKQQQHQHQQRPSACWKVRASEGAINTSNPIREVIETMNLAENPDKKVIPLSIGDPTIFGNLKPCKEILEAIERANNCGKYYGYQTAAGMEAAREAVADYHFRCTGNRVGRQDVILASGCSHAIDLSICVLAQHGQNILIPRPGFPLYKTLTSVYGVQFKQYDLLADQNWSIDLEHLESLIDKDTAAIVVNNPSNPCGSVFSKRHLLQILRLAEKHRLPIIADEIYDKFIFSPELYESPTITTTTTTTTTSTKSSKQQKCACHHRHRSGHSSRRGSSQHQLLQHPAAVDNVCSNGHKATPTTTQQQLVVGCSIAKTKNNLENWQPTNGTPTKILVGSADGGSLASDESASSDSDHYIDSESYPGDDRLGPAQDDSDSCNEDEDDEEEEEEEDEVVETESSDESIDQDGHDGLCYVPFRSMSSLSKVVPILTCGGISKTCLIPGLRLGWIIINDRQNIFDASVRNGLNRLTQRLMGPNSLVQGALRDILVNVPDSFYKQTMDFIFKNAKLCYDRLKLIPGLRPYMPQGSMYLMAKFDEKLFPHINGDLDFTSKLMNEESVLVLPGKCFDFPNYFRICLTVPTNVMEEALIRIEQFCSRHYENSNVPSINMNGHYHL